MKILVKPGQRFHLPETPKMFLTCERGEHEVPEAYEAEYKEAVRRGILTEVTGKQLKKNRKDGFQVKPGMTREKE